MAFLLKCAIFSFMVEVHKKEKENIGSLLRRLSERTKKSGLIDEYKRIQHFQKAETRSARRRSALSKKKRQEEFRAKRRRATV